MTGNPPYNLFPDALASQAYKYLKGFSNITSQPYKSGQPFVAQKYLFEMRLLAAATQSSSDACECPGVNADGPAPDGCLIPRIYKIPTRCTATCGAANHCKEIPGFYFPSGDPDPGCDNKAPSFSYACEALCSITSTTVCLECKPGQYGIDCSGNS